MKPINIIIICIILVSLYSCGNTNIGRLTSTHKQPNPQLIQQQKIDSIRQQQFNDDDNDGVRNYMDKCPKTPTNARVDGVGCALDMDQDGVIDLYDACPTDPGEKISESGRRGCPD